MTTPTKVARYHDKRYPHRITVCIDDAQYNKIKANISSKVREAIDNIWKSNTTKTIKEKTWL